MFVELCGIVWVFVVLTLHQLHQVPQLTMEVVHCLLYHFAVGGKLPPTNVEMVNLWCAFQLIQFEE